MCIHVARNMLKASHNESSWPIILANRKSFIWDFDGTEVEIWNNIFAKPNGLPNVSRRINEEDDSLWFEYKGITVEVPLVGDRDDNIIAIHSLSQLVKPDSEIRFCLDSRGSSEIAFVALASEDWKILEKEFDIETVGHRFLCISNDFDDFYNCAFS